MIIRPPSYEPIIGPLAFLGGPIQGARDWQHDAETIIESLSSFVNIANPRRTVTFHGDFAPELYNEQVDWESHHLARAGAFGVVMFWLEKEQVHRCDRAYAQTTRSELFEWKVRHKYEGANVVVGIDEGYTGARYVRRRFGRECPRIPLCSSLEETCRVAVRLALDLEQKKK